VFDVATGTMGEAGDILVENGRIAEVGRRIVGSKTGKQVECAGKFAVPGLFDCHTHLVHLTKGGEEEVRTKLAAFVANGVTQVRDVGGPIDIIGGMGRRIAGGEMVGPEMFYTGPMLEGSPLTYEEINEEYPGFTVAVDTTEDVDRLLPDLAHQGASCIKVFNKMDREVFRHLAAVARRELLRVALDPGMPLFHRLPMGEAVEMGVTSIEHAKAPWPVVLTDELREQHDALLAKDAGEMTQMAFTMRVSMLGAKSVSLERLRDLADEMRSKNACLCPTMQVFVTMEEMAVEQSKKKMGITEMPEMRRAGMEEVSRLVVREFADRGVRLLVGQDGCEPGGAFGEMRRLKDCGVSEAEIIKSATIYPAEWLGVADRLGSISPGKQASILVVDGNPVEDIGQLESTFVVIQNGRIVFQATSS
jgi:imidazolonepropionase-like amidohydrolase